MSIKVSHLTKIYGQQRAVDDISFTIEKGQIVGFLGPNGAGKSTTLKIATGYVPPSSGSVEVEGMDVVSNSLEVRRNIGYLPEHNPLYLEMFVHEYLHFVGKVYRIPTSRLKMRVAEIIQLCGLSKEQNKRIEALSKGYRQRVGIAQALIHDPSVLILDEPTTGLDPNQILEIRNLIKTVSVNKTVIFSTHILQEVQAICDRVVVINLGRIVADDSVNHLLKKSNNAHSLLVEFENPVPSNLLSLLPGVSSIVPVTPTSYRIEAMDLVNLRTEIVRLVSVHQLSLVGLKQEESSLEEIFRNLTTHTQQA